MRILLRCAVACMLTLGLNAGAPAQNFPDKVVKIIIPFPPGGSAEAQGRVLAQKLSEMWGQPVIIDNKPGAGTTIAANFVAKAPPDGYTLYLTYVLAHSVSAGMYSNLPYEPVKSFAPVSLITTVPYVIASQLAVKANTLRELVDLASAEPGKLSYSSSGTGAGPHLAAEMFLSRAGIQIVHVPYKGASPAITALLGAQVELTINDASVLPFIRAGKMRGLAVTSAKRWSQLPNVPTVAESGFPGYEAVSEGMILAPAGTPKVIVEQINAALRVATASPDVQRLLAVQGVEPVVSSPEELEARLNSEVAKYGQLVRQLKLTVN
jgi:tripartite-type tricarboxylate transporter receptor subunit TctC